MDEHGTPVPLVNLQGKFRPELKEFGGKYVKNEYDETKGEKDPTVDVEIAIQLKKENNLGRYKIN